MGDAPQGGRLATRWLDRPIGSKGLVVVLVPIAILVVVLGSTFWFTHVDDRAQTVAGQARQIVGAATTLENSILSAQTSVGEYLLTGDPGFRADYAHAQGAIPAQLGSLVALASDTPAGRRWAPGIDGDANGLLFDMSQLAQQAPHPTPSSTARTLLGYSQAETARLHADVASLTTAESTVVAGQRSAIRTANDVLPAIAIAAVVMALAGGITVSLLFTTGVVTRLRRLERATEAIERGEAPGDVPSGRDEIGRLSARLIDVTTQMRDHAAQRDRARRELEDILTTSPVVSLRYDVAAGRFSYASPNIGRLLGISADDVLADAGTIVDRLHPESAAALRQALEDDGGRGGERLALLLRLRREAGAEEWREVDGVFTVDTGPDGGIEAIVAYLVDVSERHEAQRAADDRRFLLESIFHASPDTIVVRDISGRVVLASSDLARVIGATGQPGVDRGPDGLVERAQRLGDLPAGERAVLDELIARCLTGERVPGPVVTTARLADDEVRTFETRARPVFDQLDDVTGTVTVSRDVTEQVRLEDSLRHATSDAERASEAKSEFLSRMSHELRTPLNAILGFAQLLELDELPDAQASSVDQIQRAGHHLLALINEVLDISRIEAGRLNLSTESVEVDAVLDEVAMLLAPVAEAADIELSVDVGAGRALRVRADRQRLLQVLLNLGSNALKYNNQGGAVAFRTDARGADHIRFEVRDTGPGIPLEQQDQLFIPFSRLGAERSAVEGTGVGLALSKQLVEVMGGTIGVESVPGHGSTFWVELDRVDTALPAASSAGGARPGRAGKRTGKPGTGADPGPGPVGNGDRSGPRPSRGIVVLHIEDNASNASLVEQVLAKRPAVRLVSAAEGHSGLELARQHRPDLVLLDLHLPDLSGVELVHRLKAMPELVDTKIIIVSADATAGRIREMLDLGVEGYLTKPVDVGALLRLVDHQMGADQG